MNRRGHISPTYLVYGAFATLIIVLLIVFNSNAIKRWFVDIRSNASGLDRVINVYTADGELMATYEGRIDIAAGGAGEVKFDYNGKRYIYYNCFVETIADID